MLEPFAIPTKEPDIRVGIILPEDKYREIEIVTPPIGKTFVIGSDAVEYEIPGGTNISFIESDGEITFLYKQIKPHIADSWYIKWLSDSEPQPDTGILIKQVVTGRGFHWQKRIDQRLFGSLEIKSYGNSLVLINELPLEQYLMCVATSEMSANCPEAFIEAQTIIARSWILANVEQKHRNLSMDVCNDDCCQRYQGSTNLTRTSIIGTQNTRGKVLTFQGKICDARYSKSCGGITENFQTIWAGEPVPYLSSVIDAEETFYHEAFPLNNEKSLRLWIENEPETFCSSKTIPENELIRYLGSVDEKGTYFRWTYEISTKKLSERFQQLYDREIQTIQEIIPGERGESGRLKQLFIRYFSLDGMLEEFSVDSEYRIRKLLHPNFLYSSAIVIDPIPIHAAIPEGFIIKGAGWGHGVGLCQIGALGMALKGYSVEDILNHYYSGTQIRKIYD